MRISIAIAVRDGERYLQPLLDSLLRQTQPPYEVVAVDDESTDSTPALLEAFAADAPFPVRIERFAERRGHVAGFMHAASLCGGDVIAFCDGDDVWVERKLEVCGSELEASGAMLALHSARVVDAELRDVGFAWPDTGPTRTVPVLGLVALDVEAPGMAMVFRRELLTVADFDTRPPSRYGFGRQMLNDEWVLFLAGAVGRIRLLADELVLYRRHGANDSLGPEGRHQRRLTLRPVLENYENAAVHTRACAEYLEHASARNPAFAPRLAEAAREYRRAAESWELRVALYNARDRRTRARLLGRLVRNGAYRGRAAGGFGRPALGKDLAGGVGLRVGARPD